MFIIVFVSGTIQCPRVCGKIGLEDYGREGAWTT